MPVGTAVAGKAGIHQPQTVEKLRSCTKGTPDTRHAGTLMQRQCSRNIQNLIYTGSGSLCHAAAGVGGEGLKIAPGTFRIQNTQGKR